MGFWANISGQPSVRQRRTGGVLWAIQKGTRELISLWDSAPFLGTRPNISESHSEISTRAPFCNSPTDTLARGQPAHEFGTGAHALGLRGRRDHPKALWDYKGLHNFPSNIQGMALQLQEIALPPFQYYKRGHSHRGVWIQPCRKNSERDNIGRDSCSRGSVCSAQRSETASRRAAPARSAQRMRIAAQARAARRGRGGGGGGAPRVPVGTEPLAWRHALRLRIERGTGGGSATAQGTSDGALMLRYSCDPCAARGTRRRVSGPGGGRPVGRSCSLGTPRSAASTRGGGDTWRAGSWA